MMSTGLSRLPNKPLLPELGRQQTLYREVCVHQRNGQKVNHPVPKALASDAGLSWFDGVRVWTLGSCTSLTTYMYVAQRVGADLYDSRLKSVALCHGT